jgi:O-antigen/teichoic acid export membrane protein
MKKSVFHNSILTLTRQLLSIGFGILATMVIARVLGKEGQGQYTLIILLPTLLYTLLNSGFSSSTVYFIGKKKYTDQEVYSTNLLSSIILSVVSIGLGLVLVLYFKDYFFEGVSSKLLLYTLLILPLLFIQKNLPTIFLGKEEFEKFNIIAILNQVGLLIFSLIFVWHLELGILGAVLSFGFSQLLMLTVSFYFLRQSYGLLIPKKYSLSYLKDSFVYGIKGHFSNVLTFINYRIDIFLIAFFLNDVAVGVYSIAVLLVERIWLISQSVATVLFARVVNLDQEADKNKFTSIVARNTLFITTIAGVFLALFSHWIITLLFGVQYEESVLPFLYMIPGVVLFSMSKVLANDFSGRGYPEINTYIAFVVASVNFGLNMYLIPLYGIKGAAIATSASYIVDVLLKSFYFSIKNKISFKEFYIFNSSDIQLYKKQLSKFIKK